MINVVLHNESDISFKNKSIVKLSNVVLSKFGYKSGLVNIIVLDDESLRKMKKKYFKEDVYTDVITFNLNEDPFEGEIYISYHRVIENARLFSKNFENEFKRVLIHGLLHLCGLEDYDVDMKAKMTEMENLFIHKFNQSVVN